MQSVEARRKRGSLACPPINQKSTHALAGSAKRGDPQREKVCQSRTRRASRSKALLNRKSAEVQSIAEGVTGWADLCASLPGCIVRIIESCEKVQERRSLEC
jgi:hypothetical protein